MRSGQMYRYRFWIRKSGIQDKCTDPDFPEMSQQFSER